VNILGVLIIHLVKLVIVCNERNTEYKILRELQYLHSTACEQSSSSSSSSSSSTSTDNKELALKTKTTDLTPKADIKAKERPRT